MSPSENKETSRGLFELVWNQGKGELIESFHTPTCLLNDPNVPLGAKGPEAARRYLRAFKRAFPDIHLRIDNQIAEGDAVVNFLTATGTHDGEFLGLPPTHKRVSVPAVVMLRFSHGRVAEVYSLWHALGFMRAAGAHEISLEPLATR